jgi:hypothetical protein
MKNRLGNFVLTILAIIVGGITLLGYFWEPAVPYRTVLVGWVVLLSAVAVVLGALNLGSVHLRKIFKLERGWPYSLSILVGLLIGLSAGFVAPLMAYSAKLQGTAPIAEATGLGNPYSQWVYHYLQSALGTAISGLIVFFLVFAGFRLLRRPTWRLTSVVFIIVAIVSLIGMVPFFNIDLADLVVWRDSLHAYTLNEVRAWPWVWLSQVPAVAGARGLLLGIALGAIATGLRVLLAIDRPYGE